MRDLDQDALLRISEEVVHRMGADARELTREIQTRLPNTYRMVLEMSAGMQNLDQAVGFFQGYMLALVIALRSETEPEPMKCLGFRIVPQERASGGGP